jgi:hypothetical protein
MKRIHFILLCLLSPSLLMGQKDLSAGGLKIKIDEKLAVTSITGSNEYIGSLSNPYLVRIKSASDILSPEKVSWYNNEAKVQFTNNISISLIFIEMDNYLKVQVSEVIGDKYIDALYFGPIPLSIDETIGEIVGVVRENGYAIGLQSLNAKTTGGKQTNPDGSDPARGTTATKEEHGSSLQAYCINRSRDRVYDIWNKRIPNAEIPSNSDGEILGSAIALFGCKELDVLDVIEEIELNEGLPHSTLNGIWSKRSVDANKPYLITTFTEASIDKCLEITKRLGYQSLYHSHPFSNWGHFDLIEDQFPNGWDGMKLCVEKGGELGIRIGAHTLTNFITTNDPFVSPSPHIGLMTYCQTKITKPLDVDEKEIYIANPEGYMHKDDCQALIIGNEIIRFSGVSEESPYRLLNVQRASYNTTQAAYDESTIIARLTDHPYKVFFPNWSMQKEMINKLADFFNYTGVGQLDFDGHEGGWGTGEGEFGMDYFSEQLQKQVKHELRNGSSRSNHYYWHTLSYINWGEPWYGGFTKSQGHYRYKNQALLKRNYIPNMLGWFLLNSSTTLQEIEYMLARSAGFDAGYALTGDIENFLANIEFDHIAEAINIWEEARLRKIFSTQQVEELQDVNNDFSLSKSDKDEFLLQYYDKIGFELLNEAVQPGQPNDVKVEIEIEEAQDLYIVFGAVGEDGSIKSINFEIDGFNAYTIDTELKPNWAVTYRGDNELLVYDEVGRLKSKLAIDSSKIELDSGFHTIRVSSEFSGDSDMKLNGYIRLKSLTEKVIADRATRIVN